MTFSEDALRAIEAHVWQGNVRELLSSVRRAVIMAESCRVHCEDLNLPRVATLIDGDGRILATEASDLDLRTVREVAERSAVVTALARTNGNVAKAADLLGVSRPTLYDLMRRLSVG